MTWGEFSHSIRHLSARDRQRVRAAYDLGLSVHEGQFRKSGEPFFSHPIKVATILSDWGADADTLIAALLHDSVEDTPLTLDEAEAQFGATVKTLIEGVTKLTADEVAHKPTLDESTETLRKMFRLLEQDVRIIIIKLADRLHNMQTIESLKPDRQQAIAQETLDVYVRAAEQLSMQNLRIELEDHSLKVLDPALHASLEKLQRDNEKKGSRVLESLKRTLKRSPFSSPSLEFAYEQMNWEKLRMLSTTAGGPVTGMPDIIVAIICKNVPDCYYMLGTLHQLWQREALSFQDYINSPLLNGYRGLHTTIILEDGTRVRCKIRTMEMHEYTKRGVTMLCFDDQAKGLQTYLGWTQRISPLVEDTKDKSVEFWHVLQSDILGESILVHGQEGKPMMLPKGSTALDAAFYFLRKDAFSLKSIRVNGQEAAFKTLLHYGDSISLELAKSPKVTRDWLPFAHTGLATALIRSALGEQSEETKVAIGRHLFQQLLNEKGKGFLEEFNERLLKERLESAGYESLSEALVAIGEGHLKAQELYGALFGTMDLRKRSVRHQCVITCKFDLGDQALLAALMRVCEHQKMPVSRIDVRAQPTLKKALLQVKGHMTSAEQELLLNELSAAGGEQVSISFISKRIQSIVGVLVILGLWGLDPLIAKLILHAGMPAILFTFIRAWSVVLFAFCVLSAGQREQRFSRIPLQNPALWASGIALFLVSISTYEALEITSASVYNTVMRATAVLLLTSSVFAQGKFLRLSLAWIMTLTGFILLFFTPGLTLDALTLCIGALFVFALYTIASTRFQRTARIFARFQQFFFYSTAIAALCSLGLIPFFPKEMPSHSLIGLTVLFSIVFVGVPYMLFYHLMPHVRYSYLSRSINGGLIVTLIAEGLLFGWRTVIVTGIAALFLIAGNFFISVPQKEEE
jgi:GTP diphosphokinase / guanosine-3',5'-bis(diphosphate) 3'-diphosphatase